MKKVVFVNSHLCSGSHKLVEILSENSRVQMHETGYFYNHPTVLKHLFNIKHKWDTTAAIYGDHLLSNTAFACKELYPVCKFIYFVRRPAESLGEILTKDSRYTEKTASRYYCFRLRRMCEMARKTPGAVFLTLDEMKQGLPLIEEYLNLKTPLVYKDFTAGKSAYVSGEIIDACDRSYERHLYYVKHLNLRRV